jgi:hypothetical protein
MKGQLAIVVAFACTACATNARGSEDLLSCRADLEVTRETLAAKLRGDPGSVGTRVSLGRVLRASFEDGAALRHFSIAMELAPDHPEVLREYALTTGDQRLAANLWRRLAGQRGAPGAWVAEAHERSTYIEALRGRAVNRRSSGSRAYRIGMRTARRRDNRASGWMLRVKIEGETLHMLLDTGSRGVLIAKQQADRLGLEVLSETLHRGFGDGASSRGWLTLARELEVGGLRIRDAVVEATAATIPGNVDGLIGIGVFEDFLVTLDGPGNQLRLDPQTAPAAGAGVSANVVRAGHFLLARGGTPSGEGCVLIDSGAAYSMLQSARRGGAAGAVQLEGISGGMTAHRVETPVAVSFGGYRGPIGDALYADLGPISDSIGVRVDALAGFPLLSRLVTRVNLRSGELAVLRSSETGEPLKRLSQRDTGNRGFVTGGETSGTGSHHAEKLSLTR